MAGSAATVIRAARLIDGSGDKPLEQPAVVVRDGKVEAVTQGEPPGGLEDAEVISLPGATLLPGLIDMHVHLNNPGDGTDSTEWHRENDGVLVARSAFAAQTALRAGITTVRDCGSRGTTSFDLRRTLSLGYGQGSRLVLCGNPITITGGHGWYLGGEADGEDGLRHKVRSLVKNTADFIKVLGSGGGTPNTLSYLPSFRPEEYAALVDETHRQGRRITIHCLNAATIEQAVDAGVDGIEHAGFIVDGSGRQEYVPAVGDKIAAAGVAVTSTLAVSGYVVSRLRDVDRAPDQEAFFRRWVRMREDNVAQIGQLYKAGVKIVAGTDAGWRFTPFDGLPEEMLMMSESGMPSMEVILSATSRAAEAMGLEQEIGTVRAGAAADIIAVYGNPLDDLGHLRDLRLVMQAGAVHTLAA